jgi:hypothetical protein
VTGGRDSHRGEVNDTARPSGFGFVQPAPVSELLESMTDVCLRASEIDVFPLQT